MSAAMPNTLLSIITTGMRFISWVPADQDVIALAFRLVARNGLRRMQIADPSNDPDRLKRLATMARREGIEEVVIGLTYSISPVHTHEYYAERAAILADCADMDRLYLKDPGGLLTPDAVRELAPHFARAAGDRTIELHSHCTIGLAPLVYLEGVRAGFQVVHTASGALSRGTSQPEVFSTVRNLEAIGYETDLDLDAQTAVSEHFDQIARVKGLPPGAPREFDAVYYTHQLPGGMVTTTRRMLEELRRPELFDAVLEEVTRVRAEMGYPILVTPVSQFVASQAARNVIDGKRWVNVSDETIRYFLGHYGDPAAPVDPADRRPRPVATAGEQAPRPAADHARRRARAVRPADLRGGAPPSPDDARRAGRRDDRGPRTGSDRAGAGGAPRSQPARHAAPRARAPARDHRVRADEPRRRHRGVAPCLTAWRASGSTRCAGSCSTSTARSRTAAPTVAPSPSPARSRCSSGSAPRGADWFCSRTAATSARRRWPARSGRTACR